MKILNLLAAGNTGGIEVLLKNIVQNDLLDNRICCLFDEGEIYQELKEQTDKIFSLKELKRNRNKIVDALVKYSKKEKIDIIVVHHGGINCNLIYMMLKKKLPHIKYVRYFHSCFDKFWDGRDKFLKNIVTKIVMQKAINISDQLIFISKVVQKSFEQCFNIPKEKSTIVYNGIHQDFLQCKTKPHFNNEEINMIFVGRLEKLKGVHILVQAFKDLYKNNPNIKLTIVGEGKEEKNLKQLAEKTEAGNNIYFVGRQNNIIQWLDKADIFVYPSICEEGFGISVAEAMARGCIPITFYKGGIPELISNGENGFLIKQTEEKALVAGIEKVIEMDDSERQKIIENEINTAKQFSIINTIEKLKEVYEKIVTT